MNTPHLHEGLQRDLDRIRDRLSAMAALGQRALRQCVDALVRGDRQLAYAVILRDLFIDEKEKEIDRLCLEFLVRQQPAAGPLRFAFSAIKVNLELERVGDYAESIAKQTAKLTTMNAEYPKEPFVEIADMAISMLGDAMRAFGERDEALARNVVEREEAVDLFKRRLNEQMVDLYRANKVPLEALNALTAISRRFERVSDQARNIAMEAIYVSTGVPAKHADTDLFRILFVDDHGASSSQLAEVAAASMNAPRFLFASAGLDPLPVAPVTAEYLKGLGVDASRLVPRALSDVPGLDHYHVVIFLSKAARKAFPQRAQKRILLDWFVDDPAQVQGTPEEIRAAHEKVYRSLGGQIRDLVEAIVGGTQLKLGIGEV